MLISWVVKRFCLLAPRRSRASCQEWKHYNLGSRVARTYHPPRTISIPPSASATPRKRQKIDSLKVSHMFHGTGMQAITALHNLLHPTQTCVITHSATQHQSNQAMINIPMSWSFASLLLSIILNFSLACVLPFTHCHHPPVPPPKNRFVYILFCECIAHYIEFTFLNS